MRKKRHLALYLFLFTLTQHFCCHCQPRICTKWITRLPGKGDSFLASCTPPCIRIHIQVSYMLTVTSVSDRWHGLHLPYWFNLYHSSSPPLHLSFNVTNCFKRNHVKILKERGREGKLERKLFLCLPPYPALEFSVKINCKPCSFSSLEKRLLVFSSSSILVFECGEERRRRSSRARTFKLLSNQRRPFSSLIYISIFTPFGNSKRFFDQSSPTLQKRVRNVRKRAQKSVIAFFFERILSGCTFNIRKTL